MIDVVMPQLGESVAEGTVTKWLVREGDYVKKEQPLCEVATDKADSEIPSPASGVVARLAVQPGAVPAPAVVGALAESAFAVVITNLAAPTRTVFLDIASRVSGGGGGDERPRNRSTSVAVREAGAGLRCSLIH